jgi:hypothetical protein
VVSMIFALRYGVKASLAAAIVLGLLWGVVIFNLPGGGDHARGMAVRAGRPELRRVLRQDR